MINNTTLLVIVVVLFLIHCSISKPDQEEEEKESPTTLVVLLEDGVDPNEFAQEHGLINLGQVGYLTNYYEFSPTLTRLRQMENKAKRQQSADFQGLNNNNVIDNATLFGLISQELPVSWVQAQTPKLRTKRSISPNSENALLVRILKRVSFNDPLYSNQWHHRKVFSQDVWERGLNGTGVTVAIVDDGLERIHEDLRWNYCADCSWDFNRNQADPVPLNEDDHGTSAAGVAAARDNDVCGVGVAFRARIAGIRLISQVVTDSLEAKGLSYKRDLNHIYSCSWGPTDDGRRLEGPGPLLSTALSENIANGRNGLGNIYVWASGNGRRSGDSCNYDGYANSRYTITIGAVDSRGRLSPYSEGCAALMAAAPSSGPGQPSITTTDLKGRRGKSSGDCTLTFGGTSAAAPMVAGIIALVLQANPLLTWRDVQHIIVTTSYITEKSDPDWIKNGAGFMHSHNFGFGVVNASAAIEAALKWRYVPTLYSWNSSQILVKQPLISGTPVISRTLVSEMLKLEWAEVSVWINIRKRGDLKIVLKSPYGTTSVLADKHNDGASNILGWTFTSCRIWGEESRGVWELQVFDVSQNTVPTTGTTIKPSFLSCLYKTHFIYHTDLFALLLTLTHNCREIEFAWN